MAEQLSFPQPRQTSFAPHDFYPSDASAVARGLLDDVSRWPNGKLVLTGEAGSGKTHLAHIWAGEAGGKLIAAPDIPTRSERPVAVDQADLVAGDAAAEEALFHLHNNLATAGLPLLIIARTAPATWPIKLPDLRSRLEATTVAHIDEPDDDALTAILLKLMADRQLNPAPDLARYLTARMGRSYVEIARIVEALDALSLAEKRNITTRLAARVLDAGHE
ncbi:MAG: DnaA/Hda family protein [Pseudomonadota bacterium]